MSNLSSIIATTFNTVQDNIILKEDFSEFSINIDLDDTRTIHYETLITFLETFKLDDDQYSFLETEQMTSLDEINDQSDLDELIEANNNQLDIVFRKINNHTKIKIYSNDAFHNFLLSNYDSYTLAEELYSRISKSILTDKQKIQLRLNPKDLSTDDEIKFENDCIVICNQHQTNTQLNEDIKYKLSDLTMYSKVINSSTSFELNPYYMKFNCPIPEYLNPIVQLLNFSVELLCMTLLTNYTIVSDSTIEFKLDKKLLLIDKSFLMQNQMIISKSYYSKILQWVDESTNVQEKLIIIRDILCNRLSNDNLQINSNDFDTIESAYDIYIKGYTKLFLEAKQGIIGQINSIISEFYDNLNNFTTSFKQSFFSILTFMFLTVGLNSFSKDATSSLFSNKDFMLILSLTLFALNIFNLLSDYSYSKKFKLAREKMIALKECYIGLISKNELNKLFDPANQINGIIEKYRKIYAAYSTVWATLTITGLLISASKLLSYKSSTLGAVIILYGLFIAVIKILIVFEVMKTQD